MEISLVYYKSPNQLKNYLNRILACTKADNRVNALKLTLFSILNTIGMRFLPSLEKYAKAQYAPAIFQVKGLRIKVRNINEFYSLFAAHQLQEMEILERLARRVGGNAVDGGGFIGTHALAMAKHANVSCFEPNPYMAELIKENISLNRLPVKLYQLALHDKEGEASFNIEENSSSMSRLGSGNFKVKTLPLDNLNLKNVSILKLDLEGNELNALKGAKQTIERWKPVIMFEATSNRELSNIANFLADFGYHKYYKLNHLTYLTYVGKSVDLNKCLEIK